jgi:hypothetical protein
MPIAGGCYTDLDGCLKAAEDSAAGKCAIRNSFAALSFPIHARVFRIAYDADFNLL